jgi:hypothetical protein
MNFFIKQGHLLLLLLLLHLQATSRHHQSSQQGSRQLQGPLVSTAARARPHGARAALRAMASRASHHTVASCRIVAACPANHEAAVALSEELRQLSVTSKAIQRQCQALLQCKDGGVLRNPSRMPAVCFSADVTPRWMLPACPAPCNSGAHPDTQHADQLATRPDIRTAWGPPTVPGTTQQQQQQQFGAYAAAAHTGSLPSSGGMPGSAGSAGFVGMRPGETGSGHYGRPHSTASSCYSPRFFMNGEEVPADTVQLPPYSANFAEQQQSDGPAPCQHCCHQQAHDRQQGTRTRPLQPQLAWGVGSSAGHGQPGSSSGSSSGSSTRCASQGGFQAAAADSSCCPCCSTAPGQRICGALAGQPALAQLPRTRAATYSAAFSPAAGFHFQQYMDSLKLAGSIRPASAAAAYVNYQQRQVGMR